MNENKTEQTNGSRSFEERVFARLDTVEQRFAGVDARFNELSTQLDDGIRGVEQKMDVLNQYFLELRADQRYTDRRLEKIESQSKPS